MEQNFGFEFQRHRNGKTEEKEIIFSCSDNFIRASAFISPLSLDDRQFKINRSMGAEQEKIDFIEIEKN